MVALVRGHKNAGVRVCSYALICEGVEVWFVKGSSILWIF